jgi:hypothetical protein
MNIRRLAIPAALASLILVSACTSKRREQAEESGQERVQTQVAPPVSTDSIGESRSDAGTPRSSSVTEIFSRMHEHESHLSQIITAGELTEVESEALAIRSLLLEAVGKANVPADQKSALDNHEAVAKYAIASVIKAAKSGDVNDTKAQNSRMQGELGEVERILVGPGT